MIKQKIRTIIKSIILRFLEIVYNTASIFKKKKVFSLESIDKVVLLHTKPLGLGDLVLLSPFYLLVIKNIQKPIFIVSDYPQFLEFYNTKWLKPDEVNDEFFKNSLVISPTLTLPHLKYIFKSKFYLGYFILNRLISNFSKKYYKYDAVNEHYLDKTFPILDELKISYDRNELKYPKVFDNSSLELPDQYVVFAPYANWKEKQYSKNNYLDIINKIYKINSCVNIILIGSNNPEEIAFNKSIEDKLILKRCLNLTGKTSIMDINKIIKNSILFVGNDSGPANIAYISAPKTIVVFGAVNVDSIIPKNHQIKSNITVLNNSCSCGFYPCYDGYNKPYCKNFEKYSCLDVAIADDILKNILDFSCVE